MRAQVIDPHHAVLDQRLGEQRGRARRPELLETLDIERACGVECEPLACRAVLLAEHPALCPDELAHLIGDELDQPLAIELAAERAAQAMQSLVDPALLFRAQTGALGVVDIDDHARELDRAAVGAADDAPMRPDPEVGAVVPAHAHLRLVGDALAQRTLEVGRSDRTIVGMDRSEVCAGMADLDADQGPIRGVPRAAHGLQIDPPGTRSSGAQRRA